MISGEKSESLSQPPSCPENASELARRDSDSDETLTESDLDSYHEVEINSKSEKGPNSSSKHIMYNALDRNQVGVDFDEGVKEILTPTLDTNNIIKQKIITDSGNESFVTIVAEKKSQYILPSHSKLLNAIHGNEEVGARTDIGSNGIPSHSHGVNNSKGSEKLRMHWFKKRGHFTFRVKSTKKNHESGCFDHLHLARGKVSSWFKEFCWSCGHVPDVEFAQELIGEEVKFKTLTERLREEWENADTNKDGEVSVEEMRDMLHRLNIHIPYDQVCAWMREYDSDGDGVLGLEEFELMFEKLQSLPDLREEFLRALHHNGEDMDSTEVEEEMKKLERMYILPADLAWFFKWSSNGQYCPSENACAALIHRYSPNKETKSTFSSSLRNTRARGKSTDSDSSFSGQLRTKFQSMQSLASPRSRARKLQQLKESKIDANKDSDSDLQMSYESFVVMLADAHRNRAGDPHKLDVVFQDMTLPLSNYFISSSHNSYLLGNQLNSVSSPVAIERILKLGVRIIELDAWNGDDGQPIVTHGRTLCKPTSFESCIHAIKTYAFVATEYPCIITIENHCSMKQQLVQVELLESILGDVLFKWPGGATLDDNDDVLRNSGPLSWLSPEDLKNKVIIRDRPQKKLTKSERQLIKSRKISATAYEVQSPGHDSKGKSKFSGVYGVGFVLDTVETMVIESAKNIKIRVPGEFISLTPKTVREKEEVEENDHASENENVKKQLERVSSSSLTEVEASSSEDERKEDASFIDDRDDLDADKDGVHPALLRLMYIRNIPLPQTDVSEDGTVVHSSVKFKDPGFASSSSLVETKMRKLAKPGPSVSALNSYSKRHLIRVFPGGIRITSSNFDPIPAWLGGCQIVALNYQKFGRKVWLNQGKFRMNGGCGFVLKPEVMRNSVSTGLIENNRLKVISESVNLAHSHSEEPTSIKVPSKAKKLTGHDSICVNHTLPWTLKSSFPKSQLKVTIISGHYLPRTTGAEKNNRREIINPYIDLSMHGLMEKEGEHKNVYKTYWVSANGFNPRWNESFTFDVLLPELSLLSFVVRSKDSNTGNAKKGNFVAQQVIPVSAIRCGYRVVPLCFLNGAQMDSAMLFCRFVWI